jgi:DNA-binding MarR family transcriptional regulator
MKTEYLDFNTKDINTRIMILFLQTSMAVMKDAVRCFQGKGISSNQFVVLQVLALNEGAMSHAEIARWTQTKANNITTMVDRMTKNGFVTREIDARDERLVWVKMTSKGFKTLAKAQPVAEQFVRKIMASVSSPERLENDLKRMRDNTL